jgi:hypothetical protein
MGGKVYYYNPLGGSFKYHFESRIPWQIGGEFGKEHRKTPKELTPMNKMGVPGLAVGPALGEEYQGQPFTGFKVAFRSAKAAPLSRSERRLSTPNPGLTMSDA